MGKVFKTPEVLRVYVGSFWDEDYYNDHNAALFDAEATDFIPDLRGLPRHCATRKKINEFVKRTRQMKVHVIIIEHLRRQFGWFGSKDKKQMKLLNNLRREFKEIAKRVAVQIRCIAKLTLLQTVFNSTGIAHLDHAANNVHTRSQTDAPHDGRQSYTAFILSQDLRVSTECRSKDCKNASRNLRVLSPARGIISDIQRI